MNLKIIFIFIFCLLAVNSANALTSQGTNACAATDEGLGQLKCLNEAYSDKNTTDLCNDINVTYKENFKCKKPDVVPFDKNKEISDSELTTLANYVAFKGYNFKGDGAASAVAFTPKETFITTADKVMQVSTTDMAFFKGEINRRYKSFVDAYKCNPVITTSIEHDQLAPVSEVFEMVKKCGSAITKKETITAFLNKLKANKFGVKASGTGVYVYDRDKYLDDYEKLLKNGFYNGQKFCSNILYVQCATPVEKISNEFSCPPIILDDYFQDNQYKTTKTILDVNDKKNKYAVACIKKVKEKGSAEIAKIIINSSASTLNNTQGLCSKGFIHLSKKRAEEAFKKTQQELKALGMTAKNEVLKTNYYGANGDGTSGPCAYQLNTDGTMGINSSLPSAEIKTILTPYKYVRITVVFKDKNSQPRTPVSGELCCEVHRPCREIEFECPALRTGKVPSTTFYKAL